MKISWRFNFFVVNGFQGEDTVQGPDNCYAAVDAKEIPEATASKEVFVKIFSHRLASQRLAINDEYAKLTYEVS